MRLFIGKSDHGKSNFNHGRNIRNVFGIKSSHIFKWILDTTKHIQHLRVFLLVCLNSFISANCFTLSKKTLTLSSSSWLCWGIFIQQVCLQNFLIKQNMFLWNFCHLFPVLFYEWSRSIIDLPIFPGFFLGIISWKGPLLFYGRGGGWGWGWRLGFGFQLGGLTLKWGGTPWGGHQLWCGGGVKKNHKMVPPPPPSTKGNSAKELGK